jgi:hypothetical protein
MPRLAPVRRSGGRIAAERSPRDRGRGPYLTIAAENDGALKDPFADEDLQPSRSRLKNPPAENLPLEAMPDERPQPLQNDPFNVPPAKAPTDPFEEPSRPGILPSPSDLPPPPAPPQSLITPEPPKEPTSPCETDKKECRNALERLNANTIDKIALSIRINGAEGSDFPCECTLGNEKFVGRHWSGTTFTYKAAGTCHKPLYFEDVQLERYGHTLNPALQSIFSGAHFFANVGLLPYHIGVNPPNECIYSLGYYRPGDCAPYVIEPFPISIRGAVLEVGAIATGMWILNLYSPTVPLVGHGL